MNGTTMTQPSLSLSRSARLVPLLTLLAAAALLQACGRKDDDRTVGQKVDAVVSRTEQRAGEMKADATQAGRDAGQAISSTTDKVVGKAKDAAITAEVKAKLAGDSQLSALAINVDTVDGRVVLRGVAPDTASRSRATELARAVDGTSQVENELSVQAR
jgi:hypothetical protein